MNDRRMGPLEVERRTERFLEDRAHRDALAVVAGIGIGVVLLSGIVAILLTVVS